MAESNKALTQCSHRKQSVCLFKQMVHLPLHLSAIRCNYLSQQGQLQRVKSIPQCRSGLDCFQHNIIFLLVVCSHLIRRVCTSSCFAVCFAYSGCHHMARVHVISLLFALRWNPFLRILPHTTDALPADVCVWNSGTKKDPVLWFSNTATRTLLVPIFRRPLKGRSACSAYSVISMKKARLYLLLMFI